MSNEINEININTEETTEVVGICFKDGGKVYYFAPNGTNAKVGEYAIVAKRKGNKWYIGGMTNNQEQERTFELPLDFLPEGQVYGTSLRST